MTHLSKCLLTCSLFLFSQTQALAISTSQDGRRVQFTRGNQALIVEVVSDDVLHFEVTTNAGGHDINKPVYTTPMVADPSLKPAKIQVTNQGLATQRLTVTVDPNTLCVSTYDKSLQRQLVRNCPFNLEKDWKGLTLDMEGIRNLYGLGNYFQDPGTADGDWVGRVWDPGANSHGNSLRAFEGGATSYAMFPILYALGDGSHSFAVFLDQVYKQMWSFNSSPWRVEMWGDQIRWYVIAGDNVRDVRREFMRLSGKPPIPPKKVLGLWVSEFGFENWPEAYKPVVSLRNNGFPLDGLGMDLQWFGGSFYNPGDNTQSSRMGSLSFDSKNFPNAAHEIRHLRQERGVNLMLIEESYVSKFLGEHDVMGSKNYLANWCGTLSPVFLTSNPWWGVGGMIDWTNPGAGRQWHNMKRQKLYELGITDHWTDLGEPEMYDPGACYYGFPEIGKQQHGDIHNIYNLKWIESIWNGYKENKNHLRPYSMARSGTVGLQRFGAGMWSGDIGANMRSMAAHYRVQGNMSWSGIDYFSSDVGGFHRRPDTLDGDQNELFTQWFANAALFDFPVRSHTWNLANNLKTSPDEIGHRDSNRFNIQLRYRLAPYYYSLARQASVSGDPVIPPMSYHFQEDLRVRKMGNQKMIGPFLMGAIVARYGEKDRNVYLPSGTWFNFHDHTRYVSGGQDISNVSEWQNGIFRVPLFAREGSLIPMMYVDRKTMNILGRREGEATNTDLHLRVYPSTKGSEFVLYEDDGESVAYRSGAFSTTRLWQRREGSVTKVGVDASQGSFDQMPSARNQTLEIVTGGEKLSQVTVNGVVVSQCSSEEQQSQAPSCWIQRGPVAVIKTGSLPVSANKIIEVR